jgi:hypothetical protein
MKRMRKSSVPMSESWSVCWSRSMSWSDSMSWSAHVILSWSWTWNRSKR